MNADRLPFELLALLSGFAWLGYLIARVVERCSDRLTDDPVERDEGEHERQDHSGEEDQDVGSGERCGSHARIVARGGSR